MKALIYILLMLNLFYSCKTTKEERRIVVDDMVDYREVLFGVDDSLPIFKLDTMCSANELAHSVKAFFSKDTINERIDFGLTISPNKNIKVGVFNEFYSWYPGYYGYYFKVDLQQVSKGFTYNSCSLGQQLIIDSLVFYSIINEKQSFDKIVKFNWNNYFEEVHFIKDSLVHVFTEIENGYLLAYDSLSKRIFTF